MQLPIDLVLQLADGWAPKPQYMAMTVQPKLRLPHQTAGTRDRLPIRVKTRIENSQPHQARADDRARRYGNEHASAHDPAGKNEPVLDGHEAHAKHGEPYPAPAQMAGQEVKRIPKMDGVLSSPNQFNAYFCRFTPKFEQFIAIGLQPNLIRGKVHPSQQTNPTQRKQK